MRYYISAILFSLVPFHAFACSPQEPIMVPPKTPDGEFTYIHPPTAREQFIEDLSKSKSHAIVRIHGDHHSQSHPFDAQTEFKVLYGWGKRQLEIQKLLREETSCGAPE